MCHPERFAFSQHPQAGHEVNRVCESDCTDLPHQLCLSVHASSINPILCGLESVRTLGCGRSYGQHEGRTPTYGYEPTREAALAPFAKEEGGISEGPRDDGPTDEETPDTPKKIKIKLADGKERTIQHMMATTFWSPDGKPISAAQFVERLFGELPQFFKDEDELRRIWSQPDTRKALLTSLTEKGFGGERLAEVSRMINAEKSDLFDVLGYIAFALTPITRSERVEARKSNILFRYDEKLQAFLDFVLAQYVKEGVGELDQEKLTSRAKISVGSRCD